MQKLLADSSNILSTLMRIWYAVLIVEMFPFPARMPIPSTKPPYRALTMSKTRFTQHTRLAEHAPTNKPILQP